jgi:O-antigen/teichoic acid export membrane protein
MDWWSASGHLTLYSIIGGIPVAFDTWLVGYLSQTEGEIAIFRYGAKELPLFMILLGSVHLMILSDTDTLDQALKKIRGQISRFFPLLAGLSGALCLLSPILFPLLFTEAFSESALIFNVYLLLLLSRMNLSHTLMMRLESFWVMNIIAGLEVVINVVLSLWWVQYWGWMGVALATVVAYIFEKVIFSIWLYFKEGIPITAYLPLRSYIGYSSAVVICFLIGSFIIY